MLIAKRYFLVLSFGIILGQMNLLAKEEGQYVTTKFINQTKYKLWFESDVEGVGKKRGGAFYDPFGMEWIDSGKTVEKKSKEHAPVGRAAIYYTMHKNPNIETVSPFHQIILQGKNELIEFPEFKVSIEAEPMTIYYPLVETVQPRRAYHYFNYTIKVFDAPKSTESFASKEQPKSL